MAFGVQRGFRIQILLWYICTLVGFKRLAVIIRLLGVNFSRSTYGIFLRLLGVILVGFRGIAWVGFGGIHFVWGVITYHDAGPRGRRRPRPWYVPPRRYVDVINMMLMKENDELRRQRERRIQGETRVV